MPRRSLRRVLSVPHAALAAEVRAAVARSGHGQRVAAAHVEDTVRGAWPVHLELPGATLLYSTAQLFQHFQAGRDECYFFFNPVNLKAEVTQIRQATPMPPQQHVPVPFAPEKADFAHAAAWNIALPDWPASLSGVLLRLDYSGDVARLSSSGNLLDDNFFNGTPWTVGLADLGVTPGESLKLEILAFRPHESIALQPRMPVPSGATLKRVSLIPEYKLLFSLTSH
jgi:hypothetical protein